jgi:hypothetical protein
MRLFSFPSYLIAAFAFLLFLAACKKEESFEVGVPARGSLRSDVTGDCLPKTAAGAYIAGSALADSNYLEIEVDVTTAGAYTIRTDTVNGYSFSTTGNFTTTGITKVRLIGNGTPLAAGDNLIPVYFDTTFCLVPVTVLPAGSGSGPAVFSLNRGDADACMDATVSGNYVQNQALTGSNSVAIKVNVTTPGTYTVTTNSANEFSFSGSGTLAAPGEQTIVLTATGTPVTEGATAFTVTAGSSTCTFTVTVLPEGTAPVNTDLLPLTEDSWWSYVQQEGELEDTFKVTNIGPAMIDGRQYNHFVYTDPGQEDGNAFFRKEGDNYYEYADVTKYSALTFEPRVLGEILFLKENLTPGDTWQSAEFTGTSLGTNVSLHYEFICTGVDETLPLNGNTYSGVTKVEFKAVSVTNGVTADAGPVITLYFAKGIGLVYQAAEGIEEFTAYIKNYSIK